MRRENLNGLVSDLTEQASALKEAIRRGPRCSRKQSAGSRRSDAQAAAQIVVPKVDRAATLASLHAGAATFDRQRPR